MRLGEIAHVFIVTFLVYSSIGVLEGDRGTWVVGETFYMEQTLALVTCLFVFSASIKLGIAQGTSDIYRRWVCTI